MTLHLKSEDIAWIAGLLEGEGSFSVDKGKRRNYVISETPATPVLQITMTDEDVITQLANLLNKKVINPKRKTSTGKSTYKLMVTDRATVGYLYPLIFPYMGERRQKQLQRGIDLIQEWKDWKLNGGLSKMAREGAKAKAKLKEKNLLTSTSLIGTE